MFLKKGVSLKGLQPQTIVAMMVAEALCRKHKVDLVITSGSEGKHGNGSLHFVGAAFDMRTRDMEDEVKFTQDLRVALSGEYDILLEDNHIHVEYQPKH